MKGFKEFIMRGNLIDTAVAFIMGIAFASVVTSFTNLLLSCIGKVLGGKEPNFNDWAPGGIPVGVFLTALISFLLLALVVYYAIVLPVNKFREITEKDAEETPESDTAILAEIRDHLVSGGSSDAKRSAGSDFPEA
ncbi:large conductance mechanosensitive channel protein MscL [Propionibacterium sp.]|uniref:large conductance mechanosensitive channel protein MscL n=1 Tax=Propionibacterium sp. TaxID=1977903 RepID=UPI0039EC2E46